MHNSGDSRRENAPARPHRCLTIESELARLRLERGDDRRSTGNDPRALRVYIRAGVLIKSSCGNLIAALCWLLRVLGATPGSGLPRTIHRNSPCRLERRGFCLAGSKVRRAPGRIDMNISPTCSSSLLLRR
jgi:hypothetical protein